MPPAKSNIAVIAFGGNKGDVRQNIARALAMLENLGRVEKISPLFITEPEGFKEQPDFINGALLLKTELGARELLKELKNIEAQAGRTPNFTNGPREMDLDIIFFNNEIIDAPGLTIPHPRAKNRDFVLMPLSFIAPGYKHPATGETVSQMLKYVIEAKYAVKDMK